MPLYEFECPNCRKTFEKLTKRTNVKTATCPKCKRPRCKKIISNCSFELKGGGWYKDGYDKTGGKNGKEAKKKPTGSQDR